MESDYQHSVLIIEGDTQIKRTISDILNDQEILTCFCDTGEDGLEAIKKARQPFSLMVSAQNLKGMTGTSFLEQARLKAPGSVQVLMAVYSEIEIIINAVNKSDVQRFLVKPFEKEDFLKAIHSGTTLYDSFIEHEKLLALAKKQNSKLYELNCELMEATKAHNKTIHDLDREIETINNDIKALSVKETRKPPDILRRILDHVSIDQQIDEDRVRTLFEQTLYCLHNQFEELAQRNGFEMPPVEAPTDKGAL